MWGGFSSSDWFKAGSKIKTLHSPLTHTDRFVDKHFIYKVKTGSEQLKVALPSDGTREVKYRARQKGLRECCRQSQVEYSSNRSNNIHQTWGPPFCRAL